MTQKLAALSITSDADVAALRSLGVLVQQRYLAQESSVLLVELMQRM